jgi:hypothetical protein
MSILCFKLFYEVFFIHIINLSQCPFIIFYEIILNKISNINLTQTPILEFVFINMYKKNKNNNNKNSWKLKIIMNCWEPRTEHDLNFFFLIGFTVLVVSEDWNNHDLKICFFLLLVIVFKWSLFSFWMDSIFSMYRYLF